MSARREIVRRLVILHLSNPAGRALHAGARPGYRAAMDCTNLTRQQMEDLRQAIRVRLGFLNRLLRRMEKLGFAPDDRLYAATARAYSAMHELNVVAIYLCPGGAQAPDIGMASTASCR
jgi:hypothetical protein